MAETGTRPYEPLKPIIDNAVAQDFNRFVQNMDLQLREFELFLNGQRLVRNEQGDLILLNECNSRVNATGKQEIMSNLRMLCNPNTYMAQTSEEDTEKNFIIKSVSVYRMLSQNHIKYDLTIPNAMIIADTICEISFYAFRKAQSDKAAIYGTMHSNNTPAPDQNVQNFLGLSGLFKRQQ